MPDHDDEPLPVSCALQLCPGSTTALQQVLRWVWFGFFDLTQHISTSYFNIMDCWWWLPSIHFKEETKTVRKVNLKMIRPSLNVEAWKCHCVRKGYNYWRSVRGGTLLWMECVP